MVVIANSPAEFAAAIKAEARRWAELSKESPVSGYGLTQRHVARAFRGVEAQELQKYHDAGSFFRFGLLCS